MQKAPARHKFVNKYTQDLKAPDGLLKGVSAGYDGSAVGTDKAKNKMKTLIQDAQVVLPGGVEQVSVLIDGAKICDIDVAATVAADETIDATGLYLIPGVIDDQVHFREPGLTHKEDLTSASRACAKGGVKKIT